MLSQLSRVILRPGVVLVFQGTRDLLVQSEPSGRQQLLMEGLPEEGMCEAIADLAGAGPLRQQAHPDRFLQRGHERLLLHPRHALQRLQPDHGGDRQHPVALDAEP